MPIDVSCHHCVPVSRRDAGTQWVVDELIILKHHTFSCIPIHQSALQQLGWETGCSGASPGNRALRFPGGSRTQLRFSRGVPSRVQSTTCSCGSPDPCCQVTSRSVLPAMLLTTTPRGAESEPKGQGEEVSAAHSGGPLLALPGH